MKNLILLFVLFLTFNINEGYSSTPTSYSFEINTILSNDKQVKIFRFKTDLNMQKVEYLLSKQEDVLHLAYEGNIVMIYTEPTFTNAQFSQLLSNAEIGTVHYDILGTPKVAMRDERLFRN